VFPIGDFGDFSSADMDNGGGDFGLGGRRSEALHATRFVQSCMELQVDRYRNKSLKECEDASGDCVCSQIEDDPVVERGKKAHYKMQTHSRGRPVRLFHMATSTQRQVLTGTPDLELRARRNGEGVTVALRARRSRQEWPKGTAGRHRAKTFV